MSERAILVKADGARGPGLGLLPRCVRRVSASAPARDDRLVEFEVVSGNAAFREGERFYLSAAEARKAYPSTLISLL